MRLKKITHSDSRLSDFKFHYNEPIQNDSHAISYSIPKTEMQWSTCNMEHHHSVLFYIYIYISFFSFPTKKKTINTACTHVRECIFLSLLHTIRIYYVTAVTRMHTHRGLVFPVCGMILILIYAKYPNSLSRNIIIY